MMSTRYRFGMVAVLLAAGCGGSAAPDPHETRADGAVDRGRMEEELGSLDRLIESHPDVAEHHLERSNLLRALGRDEEADAAYDRYAELLPYRDIPLLGYR